MAKHTQLTYINSKSYTNHIYKSQKIHKSNTYIAKHTHITYIITKYTQITYIYRKTYINRIDKSQNIHKLHT